MLIKKKEDIINKINIFLPLLFGICFYFLNLGVSILHIFIFGLLIAYYKNNSIKIDKSQIIFIIFILYIILSNIIFGYKNLSINFLMDNILLLKFITLYLFIDLFLKQLLKSELFIKINLFFLIFLIFEVYLQRITGYEIFGYPLHPYNRATGPYGEELVIGTLILFLGFHSFFYYLIKTEFNYKILTNLYFITFFNIYFFSIFLTGERMNFLISLMVILLMFIFLIKKRVKIILSSIIFIILITISLNYTVMGNKYSNFLDLFNFTSQISLDTKKKENNHPLKNIKKNPKPKVINYHVSHYLVSYEIWKDHKFFGSGVKSFRKICSDYDNIDYFLKDKRCTTHPHNFIIEIVTETGLIGFFIFLIFFCSFINKKNFSKMILMIHNKKINPYLVSFLIITIVLLWPLKTSGRFFSNFYGSIFLFNTFIFISLLKRLK